MSFQIAPFFNLVFEEKTHSNSQKHPGKREFLDGNLHCKYVAPAKTKLFSAVRSQTTNTLRNAGHLYHYWCLATNFRIGFYNGEMIFNRALGNGWLDLDDFFGRSSRNIISDEMVKSPLALLHAPAQKFRICVKQIFAQMCFVVFVL